MIYNEKIGNDETYENLSDKVGLFESKIKEDLKKDFYGNYLKFMSDV